MATGLNLNPSPRPPAGATAAPAKPGGPAAVGPRAEAVRAAYLELKANVHRKLLNRLNLEALATVDRAQPDFAAISS